MPHKGTPGEASIYKDENGRWHGWITVGLKTNGQRDRRHRSGKTRKEVVDKIRALEVKRETGQISAVTSDTVTGWLEHWLTNIAARRVRPRTLESYESMIRMHISPGIGRHRLDRLQPEHLEHFYSDLLAEGLSAATVLRAHRIISRALKVAMQRGRVHRNVAGLVDPPAQRRSEAATALDLDEARAVLAAANGLRNSARWTVALALGLRQSEALALQWRDIDLLNNTPERPPHPAPRQRRVAWSTRRPKPNAANAPWPCRCRWSRPCTPTRPPRWANGCWPARIGRARTTSCSRRPTAARSTRRPITTTVPTAGTGRGAARALA